jgi:hypothetical protein
MGTDRWNELCHHHPGSFRLRFRGATGGVFQMKSAMANADFGNVSCLINACTGHAGMVAVFPVGAMFPCRWRFG